MQPSNGNKVKLGILLSSVSETHKFDKSELIFLNTSDIYQGKILHGNYSEVNKMPGQAKKSVQSGDILFSEIRPANGRWAILTGETKDLVVSTKLMVLRTNLKLALPEFMYIYLTSSVITSKLQSVAEYRSATFPQITFEQVSDLEIDLPSVAEQKVIIRSIKSIDDKIEVNLSVSQTLQDIAQTIFKSWFIDFDPVKAKMAGEKPAGMDAATAALFPDAMEESELGLIPKGWRVGSLGEIADLQGGYAFKSSSWTESGVPVIKIGSVKPGFVDLTQVSYVDASTAETIPDEYRIPAGSLVVGLTGYVGQVGLVRTHVPVPLVNQRVAKFKLKSGEWKIPFIYCFTRGEKFKGIVEELATGTAQQNVSNSQILSIPMIIPSQEIQKIFENSLNSFFHQIINLADENESLKSTRDALLPRLISGELQIPKEMLAS
jgi:type I restriction enzyme S subunit